MWREKELFIHPADRVAIRLHFYVYRLGTTGKMSRMQPSDIGVSWFGA
jgi:hypothetical protein